MDKRPTVAQKAKTSIVVEAALYQARKARRAAVIAASALLMAPQVCGASPVGFRNPVEAKGSASCGNVFLVTQLADAYTTRTVILRGGYERDPLAKPFVRSNAGAYGVALFANVVARIVTRRSPSLMCVAAGIESIAVANNIRVIGRE